jgi:glucose dehydrogenase
VQADRNGFFYILDRVSGKFLHAVPFVQKLNWARGIDASGRPMLTGRIPSAQGTYICPGGTGATNWYSPSYNPVTKLFYVMALESCDEYFARARPFIHGETFYNTGTKRPPNQHSQKVLLALSVSDGQPVWRYPQVGRGDSFGGTLTTAGGLVFFGDDATPSRRLTHEAGVRFGISTPRKNSWLHRWRTLSVASSTLESRCKATSLLLPSHIEVLTRLQLVFAVALVRQTI